MLPAVVSVAVLATTIPPVSEIYPPRLTLGTIYPGSIAEAGVLVRVPGDDAGVRFDVAAPPFARILSKGIRAEPRRRGRSYLVATVEVSLIAANPGELAGDLVVTIGRAVARIPLNATVAARRDGLTRLLVAQTPFAPAATDDPAELDGWARLTGDAGLDVTALLVAPGRPVLRDLDLVKFDCIVLAQAGLVHLTPADRSRVQAYVEAGGRVVVAAGKGIRGTVEQANAILRESGLVLQGKDAGAGRVLVTLGKADLDPDLKAAGVGSVHFFRGSPIRVTGGAGGRVLVRAAGVGGPGDGFVASARFGKGEVVAIGHALWWQWVSKAGSMGTDNAKVLRWILTRPQAR